jgi:hypothetical protein
MRALWFGNNGAIPANWQRDTDYDTFYLEGDGLEAGDTGGAVSHDHDVDDHGLTGNAHTHDAYSNPADIELETNVAGSDLREYSDAAHSHGSATSGSRAIVYGDAVGLSTNATSEHDPPYITVIVIKPNDGNQQLPDDNSPTMPSLSGTRRRRRRAIR